MVKKSSTLRNAVKKDSRPKTADHGQQVIVRELAWTGQHPQAIDIATQTLLAPKIKLSEGGNLDIPSKYTRATQLPTNRKSKITRASLESQIVVQMQTSELKAAVKTTGIFQRHFTMNEDGLTLCC